MYHSRLGDHLPECSMRVPCLWLQNWKKRHSRNAKDSGYARRNRQSSNKKAKVKAGEQRQQGKISRAFGHSISVMQPTIYIYIYWLTSLNKKPLMVETSSCQYDTSSCSMGLPLLDLGFSNLPIDAWTILYDLFRFRTLERELGFWRDWLHNNWSNW